MEGRKALLLPPSARHHEQRTVPWRERLRRKGENLAAWSSVAVSPFFCIFTNFGEREKRSFIDVFLQQFNILMGPKLAVD